VQTLKSLRIRSTIILILLCAALAIAAPAQTFTSVADLDSANGSFPLRNGLVQGTDGNFYGTAFSGGAFGKGSVYKVTADGTISVVYSFCALAHCADGGEPSSPLVVGADGNFYGTTQGGGGGTEPAGTFFKLTPGGTLTTLHDFCSLPYCPDGGGPTGALVLALDGNFYGVASQFGNSTGSGTIFKITPTGALTTLYNFCSKTNCADGSRPLAGLVQARDGSFYGTTEGGTTENGTVFRFTSTGQFKTLYTFCTVSGCLDGNTPYGPLVVTAKGTVYGTASGGGQGAEGNGGTVFEITSTGTFSVIYRFCSVTNCDDGAGPQSGLILGTDGKLYGSTDEGGFNGKGTVFRLTSAGALARLHSFHATDGAYPMSSLVQSTDGSFYGDTSNGGPTDKANCSNSGSPFGCGTVFHLSLGLKPFIKTAQPSGGAGDSIIILGNGLTGSTSVKFNGTTAAFTVVSDTEITANVPAGATTGTIQVLTPSATLTSNTAFHVLP
jgi:uncharacterized repeat protein (TIGR03803 family)